MQVSELNIQGHILNDLERLDKDKKAIIEAFSETYTNYEA